MKFDYTSTRTALALAALQLIDAVKTAREGGDTHKVHLLETALLRTDEALKCLKSTTEKPVAIKVASLQ